MKRLKKKRKEKKEMEIQQRLKTIKEKEEQAQEKRRDALKKSAMDQQTEPQKTEPAKVEQEEQQVREAVVSATGGAHEKIKQDKQAAATIEEMSPRRMALQPSSSPSSLSPIPPASPSTPQGSPALLRKQARSSSKPSRVKRFSQLRGRPAASKRSLMTSDDAADQRVDPTTTTAKVDQILDKIKTTTGWYPGKFFRENTRPLVHLKHILKPDSCPKDSDITQLKETAVASVRLSLLEGRGLHHHSFVVIKMGRYQWVSPEGSGVGHTAAQNTVRFLMKDKEATFDIPIGDLSTSIQIWVYDSRAVQEHEAVAVGVLRVASLLKLSGRAKPESTNWLTLLPPKRAFCRSDEYVAKPCDSKVDLRVRVLLTLDKPGISSVKTLFTAAPEVAAIDPVAENLQKRSQLPSRLQLTMARLFAVVGLPIFVQDLLRWPACLFLPFLVFHLLIMASEWEFPLFFGGFMFACSIRRWYHQRKLVNEEKLIAVDEVKAPEGIIDVAQRIKLASSQLVKVEARISSIVLASEKVLSLMQGVSPLMSSLAALFLLLFTIIATALAFVVPFNWLLLIVSYFHLIPHVLACLVEAVLGKSGTLWKLSILEGKKLPAMDRGVSSDPYCIVDQSTDEAMKTKVKKKTLAPVWEDETFEVWRPNSVDGIADDIIVTMYDKDVASKDDLMGIIQVPVEATPQPIWLPLDSHGELRVSLEVAGMTFGKFQSRTEMGKKIHTWMERFQLPTGRTPSFLLSCAYNFWRKIPVYDDICVDLQPVIAEARNEVVRKNRMKIKKK